MTAITHQDRVRAYERAARAPWAFLKALINHGDLVGRFAGRASAKERRGLQLGVAWAVITPLFMLAVYGFVFGVVMNRGAAFEEVGEPAPFLLTFFAGIIVFRLFAGAITQAPTLITSQKGLATRAAFPLEVLPWSHVVSGVLVFLAPLSILVAASAVLHQMPGWTLVLLPVVLAPLMLVMVGAVFVLSALGVFLRDLTQMVPPVMVGVLFLSPVFYPLEAAPEAARPFLMVNPISPTVIALRDVVLHAAVPDWRPLAIQAGAGWLLAWAGYWFFAKTRKAFADVL
jgi:lipopolysaccharide transport system permease protein